MKAVSPCEPPADYADMLNNIKGLVEGLRGIQELGVAQYTPVVERINSIRSRDANHIQHTLDHL